MQLSVLDIARGADPAQRQLPASLDVRRKVTGIVDSIDTSANRLYGSVNESQPIAMEYVAGSYTVGEMVDCTLEYLGGTVKGFVHGRTGGTPAVTLPTVPAAPPATVEATAVIVPERTGTWRQTRYDNWNVSRAEYGGRSTLYQGSGFGSGQVYGLALYGDHIKNLGAIAITAMVLTIRDAALGITSRPAMEIRAATNTDTSAAPAFTGVTMTAPALASGQVSTLNIDASLFDSFRTGAIKALATVGVGTSKYNALRGTSAADGMALTITYTRAA